MKIFNIMLKIALPIAIIFIFIVIYQFVDVLKKHDKHFNHTISSWVSNDQKRLSVIEDYRAGCEKPKSIDTDMPIKRPLSKVECAKSLGLNDLANFIESIDYSTIEVPFPVSLFE